MVQQTSRPLEMKGRNGMANIICGIKTNVDVVAAAALGLAPEYLRGKRLIGLA